MDLRKRPVATSHFFVGCDLGQSVDPTAIAVLERHVEPIDKTTIRPNTPTRTSYNLRHLERVPLRTPYPDVVAHVAKLLDTAPLCGNSTLVADQSGVGRPIIDLFRAAKLRPVAITITSGDGWSEGDDGFRVSKLLLVSRLQALLHSGDLRIAKNLPELQPFLIELQNFHFRFTDSGIATFGARSGRHDDLVLSVAIAAWYAVERARLKATSREVIL